MFPPFAPMVLMIPRRGQGVAGEVSGSLGQLVEGSLQVVELPSARSVPAPGRIALQCSFVGFQGGDQLGVDAPAQVFRRDSTALAGRIGRGRVGRCDRRAPLYYAPRFAPLPRSDCRRCRCPLPALAVKLEGGVGVRGFPVVGRCHLRPGRPSQDPIAEIDARLSRRRPSPGRSDRR